MAGSFVIIVNYRTADLVVQCLASLAAQTAALRGGRAIVVDNASGDGSPARIRDAIAREGWATWAEVIEAPRNGGFAFGNNVGIRRVRELDARCDFVLLLNPDTIARPGLIESLASFLRDHPEAGIVGASIENEAGGLETSAHAEPSPLGELESAARLGVLSRWLGREPTAAANAAPYPCDWVSGACLAIRRGVIDSVGLLDDEFFLYFEEVDYCTRARRLGWSCWLVPSARIVHYEGAVTGIKARQRRRPAYWYASRRRFFVKRYGVAGLVVADVLWALGRCSLVVRRALRLGGRGAFDDDPVRFASDLLLGDLRALLSGTLLAIPRVAWQRAEPAIGKRSESA